MLTFPSTLNCKNASRAFLNGELESGFVCIVDESGSVQVFGRRHEEAIHALRRPASEKRQGKKSREVGHWLGSERYGDLMLASISMMSGTPARQHLDVCPREVGRVQ